MGPRLKAAALGWELRTFTKVSLMAPERPTRSSGPTLSKRLLHARTVCLDSRASRTKVAPQAHAFARFLKMVRFRCCQPAATGHSLNPCPLLYMRTDEQLATGTLQGV
eukprot:gene25078-biopygen10486